VFPVAVAPFTGGTAVPGAVAERVPVPVVAGLLLDEEDGGDGECGERNMLEHC
jgi:hypothetical protein